MYGSVRRLQRRFPIDDILFQSGDIRDQVAKLSEIGLKFSKKLQQKDRWTQVCGPEIDRRQSLI